MSFIMVTHSIHLVQEINTTAVYNVERIAMRTEGDLRWALADLPRKYGVPREIVLGLVGESRTIRFTEGEKAEEAEEGQEGKKESPETALFRYLLPRLRKYPVKGCSDVLEITRAWNKMAKSGYPLPPAYGMVDLDDMDAKQRDKLRDVGVYASIEIMEVEGLFLVKGVAEAFFKALCVCKNFSGTGGAAIYQRADRISQPDLRAFDNRRFQTVIHPEEDGKACTGDRQGLAESH